MTSRDFIVVTTTHASEEEARALATAVVRERLAACAQVYPISSVYRWEGEVRSESEWRVDFKTRADLFDRLAKSITDKHAYDTPEIVGVPLVTGSAKYLDWVNDETVQE
ncbi:divalent-cation tolerance protein CutA [Streptomyces sp. RerS4]|uniref:divalent-cation tolerance protein CutA n=1 Tax=Streptomyces sp. RerS4 TaxID=2942449 RepID=UPI00201BBE3E|nr:divalent-cation tolerance protein CutA [Streptomyces sp. RerS4]UQX03530.1 divalent-cation tolerance protein CutA [Streptomyces sp. RerS4]